MVVSQKVRLSTKILQEYSSIPVIPTDTKESADASVAFAPASAIDDGKSSQFDEGLRCILCF